MNYTSVVRVTGKTWVSPGEVIVEYQMVDRSSKGLCPDGMTLTARRARHLAPSVGDVFRVTTDMELLHPDDAAHPDYAAK